MENSEMSEREMKVFQTGLFDNLTVQDAFTISALYAAQLYTGDDKEDLAELIMSFLSKDAFFNEDHSYTIARINKFANSLGEVNPVHAIERAAEVLSPELRQKSFALAARIGKAAQEMRTRQTLARLSSKLSIDKNFADETIAHIFEKC
jgi:hypothetical protein